MFSTHSFSFYFLCIEFYGEDKQYLILEASNIVADREREHSSPHTTFPLRNPHPLP